MHPPYFQAGDAALSSLEEEVEAEADEEMKGALKKERGKEEEEEGVDASQQQKNDEEEEGVVDSDHASPDHDSVHHSNTCTPHRGPSLATFVLPTCALHRLSTYHGIYFSHMVI